jgi:hypothetical protein
MKTIINREVTAKQILGLKPELHQIVIEKDVTVLGTKLADDVTRNVCVIKEADIGWAQQRLNETGQFVTQFLPLPVELLGQIVTSEVKDEPVAPVKVKKVEVKK